MKILLRSLLSFFLLSCLIQSAFAMDDAGKKQFNRYLDMPLDDLTEAAYALLEKTYPDEDWSRWNFPKYVYTDDAVETSYMIAVKEPDLLGTANVQDKKSVIPCYCFCSRMGHDNLLYCFWKDGKPGDEFDAHASECNVCVRQALLAFVWHDLGASHDEIIQGMEKKFDRLIEMHDQGRL